MKNKIKQLGRKYIAPMIVAGALSLGGNAYADPNSYSDIVQSQKIQQTENYNLNKEEIGHKIKNFQRHKAGLEGYVTQRITDGRLSIKENVKIGNYIGDIIGNINEIRSYARDNDIELSKTQRNILSYDRELYSGIHGAVAFNGGKLEKYFANKGLDVDVKSGHAFLKLFLGLGALGLIAGPIIYKGFDSVAK